MRQRARSAKPTAIGFDSMHSIVRRRFATRAHQHDHPLGVGRTVVFVELVLSADDLGEFVHRLLDDVRACGVEWVARFPRLEENVRVLRRAAQHWPVRRESAGAMSEHEVVVDHRAQVVVGHHFNFRDFVRGAEAVEEMQKRHARFKRRPARRARGRALLAASWNRASPSQSSAPPSRPNGRRRWRARAWRRTGRRCGRRRASVRRQS